MLKDIQRRMKSSKEPAGVVVTGADGTLYFLTDQQARRASFRPDRLYPAFLLRSSAGGGKHGPAPSPNSPCGSLRRWLNSHSPHSAIWRAVCLTYFDNC
jgi:hypothetical protein